MLKSARGVDEIEQLGKWCVGFCPTKCSYQADKFLTFNHHRSYQNIHQIHVCQLPSLPTFDLRGFQALPRWREVFAATYDWARWTCSSPPCRAFCPFWSTASGCGGKNGSKKAENEVLGECVCFFKMGRCSISLQISLRQ